MGGGLDVVGAWGQAPPSPRAAWRQAFAVASGLVEAGAAVAAGLMEAGAIVVLGRVEARAVVAPGLMEPAQTSPRASWRPAPSSPRASWRPTPSSARSERGPYAGQRRGQEWRQRTTSVGLVQDTGRDKSDTGAEQARALCRTPAGTRTVPAHHLCGTRTQAVQGMSVTTTSLGLPRVVNKQCNKPGWFRSIL